MAKLAAVEGDPFGGAGQGTVLHVGQPIHSWQDIGSEVYNDEHGDTVTYNYHNNGTPWFAKWQHKNGKAENSDTFLPTDNIFFPKPSWAEGPKLQPVESDPFAAPDYHVPSYDLYTKFFKNEISVNDMLKEHEKTIASGVPLDDLNKAYYAAEKDVEVAKSKPPADPFLSEIKEIFDKYDAGKVAPVQSGKPILHVGDPIENHASAGVLKYKSEAGGDITFNYHKDGTPWYADHYGPGINGYKEHNPEDIKFPDLAIAAKNEGKSKAKESKAAESKLALAHEPNAHPFVFQNTNTYPLATGGQVTYEYYGNAEPKIAKITLADGSTTETWPDKIAFPPMTLANGMKQFMHYKPLPNSGDEAHLDTYETSDGKIEYKFHSDGSPWFANVYNDKGVLTHTLESDEVKFPEMQNPPEEEEEPQSYGEVDDKHHTLRERFYNFLHEKIGGMEKSSIKEYSGSKYADINKYLRKGKEEFDPHNYYGDQFIDDIERHIEGLDSAFEQNSIGIPPETTLYRGTHPHVWKNHVAHLEVGDTFQDPGFLSTSLLKGTAKGFGDNDGVLFKIEIPDGGTKAIYIDPISNSEGEKEVLFPRGSKFKITSIDKKKKFVTMTPIGALTETKKDPFAGVDWIRPDDKALKQEYDVEYQKYFKPQWGDVFPTFEKFKHAMDNDARMIEIDRKFDDKIAGRSQTSNFDDLHGLIKSYRSYPEFRNETTLRALHDRIKNGEETHMPIVFKLPSGAYKIFSGNTRLDLNFMHHDKAKVLLLDIAKYNEEIPF